LRQLAIKHSKSRETETAIPRVAISRCDHCEDATGPMPTFCEPMICLILQGAKCILIGDRALHYDQPSYFISTIDVPATGEIYRAGPDRPYLSITLKFDATIISDVLLSMKDNAPAASADPGSGFGISSVTPELLDSWLRLMRLLESPKDIAVLGPLIEREIIYRLLALLLILAVAEDADMRTIVVVAAAVQLAVHALQVVLLGRLGTIDVRGTLRTEAGAALLALVWFAATFVTARLTADQGLAPELIACFGAIVALTAMTWYAFPHMPAGKALARRGIALSRIGSIRGLRRPR
jgi:hypothetical protein